VTTKLGAGVIGAKLEACAPSGLGPGSKTATDRGKTSLGQNILGANVKRAKRSDTVKTCKSAAKK